MSSRPSGSGRRPLCNGAAEIQSCEIQKIIKMKRLSDRSYFFDQGIFFECQRCGACCTGEPGVIYVDKDDVLRIAHYLDLSLTRLKKKYLYPYRDSYSIKEDTDGRCLFYQDGCMVYPVRPGQCSTYPFWFENLRSLKRWRRVSRECAGIGRGSFYSKVEILEILRLNFDAAIKSRINSNTEVFDGRN